MIRDRSPDSESGDDTGRRRSLLVQVAAVVGWMILGGAMFVIVVRDLLGLDMPWVAIASVLGTLFGVWLALDSDRLRSFARRRGK